MSLAPAIITPMIFGPLPVVQAHLVYRQDRNRSTAPHTPRIGTAFRAVAPRGVRGITCSERSAHAASLRHPVVPVTRVGGRPL
jgi:hypothetical protein